MSSTPSHPNEKMCAVKHPHYRPRVKARSADAAVARWPTSILQHHERMDGSGYPLGLQGEAILLKSRILAVSDVVMASHRPYRVALGVEAALREIEDHRGSKFDAAVGDACLDLFRQHGFALDA